MQATSLTVPPSVPENAIGGETVDERTQRLEARAEKLRALVDRAFQVPGQRPKPLRSELPGFRYSVESPSAASLFGASATENELRLAFEPKRSDVRLREDDFMALTPRRSNRHIGFFGVVLAQQTQEFMAYFLWDACREPGGTLFDTIEWICAKLSAGSGGGIGTAIREQGSALFASVGSARSELEAAWFGRCRWAVDGFDFTSETARTDRIHDWGAFLREMSLDPRDLFFDRGDGEREAFSEEGIRHLWDFAAIRSVNGPTCVPTKFIWSETPVFSTHEVGKVFPLLVPPEKWSHFRTYWAVRPHAEDSEGQRQRRRCRASLATRDLGSASAQS